MDIPENYNISKLLDEKTLNKLGSLTEHIDRLYDMDRTWSKGFGEWVYEYKYRRGGKTLCTFYVKQGTAVILIILGKNEREKFEAQRESFSENILALYDETVSYHDGKWLWIPVDNVLSCDDILNMLKIKRRPNRK